MDFEERTRFQHRRELALKVLRILYKHIRGNSLSKSYRHNLKDDDKSLTFGEIVPESFFQMLQQVSGDNFGVDKVFVDLGCGIGRACLTAALTHNFRQSIGIELMPQLVAVCNDMKHLLSSAIRAKVLEYELFVAEPEKRDVVGVISNILLTMHPAAMKADFLANAVCKEIGHKEFKAAVKPFKTFLGLLKAHPEVYTLNGSPAEVTRPSESASSAPEKEELHGEDENDADSARGQAGKMTLQKLDLSLLRGREPSMEFIEGDIFEVDWWSQGDVVYVASLLFSEDMMSRLVHCVMKMKPGSWIMSLKPLPLLDDGSQQQRIHLRHESFYKMSWQMAKVYFYQIADP